MKYFFDDPRTKEIVDIIAPFRDENGVGISVYPSGDDNGGFLYCLIGFNTPMQMLRYKALRQTDDLPLEHIRGANDALIAMSNAKLHDKYLDFEITMLFDDETGEFASMEFYKDVPESKDAPKRSAPKFASDKRTLSILNMVKAIERDENCGIMVYPVDQDESSYAYSVFDYYAAEGGSMKYKLRSDMKNKFAKDIETFDDIILGMTNAKAYANCGNFELQFRFDRRNGLPSMLFFKV